LHTAKRQTGSGQTGTLEKLTSRQGIN